MTPSGTIDNGTRIKEMTYITECWIKGGMAVGEGKAAVSTWAIK